jgi:GntR family transcriptional regulator, vanillate catabolism transcriptional regulator
MLADSEMPREEHSTSQTTKATLGLRELVLGGEFKPGERVAELDLVERLGVSRTPLRTALMTLQHEGLLELLPAGGFVVRAFTRRDVVDAIELRGVLEGTAARFAAERLESRLELAGLQQCSDELDEVVHDDRLEAFVRYVTLNETFHAGLVRLAKSSPLARAIDNVVSLPFASPSALLSSQAQLRQSREILVIAQHQHRGLLESIEHGHGTRAEEIAREHARLSRINLDLALRNREILAELPGAPLLASAI